MGLGKVFGKVTSLFMGKQTPGTPGSYTELDPLQKSALGVYQNELMNFKAAPKMNVDQVARNEILAQERQARSGVEDAERQAQTLVAQRGLGKSAIGLSSLLGVRQGLGDKLAAIRAQQPGMIRQLGLENEANRLNKLGAISGGINNIFGTRMYNAPTAPSARSGGLLQPALGIGGAILGSSFGPAGAMAGYQIGSGLGQSVSNSR